MNSISGIGNRPAAIQFGSRRPSTPNATENMDIEENEGAVTLPPRLDRDEPPPIQRRLLDEFNRSANQDISLPALLPPERPNPNREESPPVQRRLLNEFNRSANQDINLPALLPPERPNPNREESPLVPRRLLDDFDQEAFNNPIQDNAQLNSPKSVLDLNPQNRPD